MSSLGKLLSSLGMVVLGLLRGLASIRVTRRSKRSG
jgi:hypothetical protein